MKMQQAMSTSAASEALEQDATLTENQINKHFNDEDKENPAQPSA